MQGRKLWRDKSPGLKILWLWTFGTAAVLVTSVVRTRIRDMEQVINGQGQDPHVADTPVSVHVIREDNS